MMLLETTNKIIESSVIQLAREGLDPVDIDYKFVDNDGVNYHLVLKEQDKTVSISVKTRNYNDLLEFDPMKNLSSVYSDKGFEVSQDAKEGVTVKYKLTYDPADEEYATQFKNIVEKLSDIKNNLFACSFNKLFESLEKGTKFDQKVLNIGEKNQMILDKDKEKVTIAIRVHFSDKNESVIGKVILQEFSNQKSVHGICSNYVKELPVELRGSGIRGEYGFMIFLIFKPQLSDRSTWKNIIRVIISFTYYLSYHSKFANLHIKSKMRIQTENLLKHWE